MIRRHSPVAVAAYHDLTSRLLDDAASDIRGAPTARERGGKTYWYDRYRIGAATRERYLGEDTPDLRRRMEQFLSLKATRDDRRRERARLVRLLRSERYLGLDNTIGGLVAALSRTGLFNLGGVIVGTAAFRLYEGELGLRLSLDETAMTNDIDIASFETLALAKDDVVEPALAEVFDSLDFTPVPALDNERTWRWRQAGSNTIVEFLTPSFRDEEDLRDLDTLGVSGQSLHHLDYLIADPIDAAAVYREGVLVKAPRPERFAIHKLIVADRRRDGPDSLKAQKDLAQADILVGVLAQDRPMDLAEAFEEAMDRGPRWRFRLENSLRRAPRIAERLDWKG